MAKPRKRVELPFDLLFPLLVYYFAQLVDKDLGGEYSLDLSWKGVCKAIDCQHKISLSSQQLESLIYSYKQGVVDRRRPFKSMTYMAKSYGWIMRELQKEIPEMFKVERDNEIVLIGEHQKDG